MKIFPSFPMDTLLEDGDQAILWRGPKGIGPSGKFWRMSNGESGLPDNRFASRNGRRAHDRAQKHSRRKVRGCYHPAGNLAGRCCAKAVKFPAIYQCRNPGHCGSDERPGLSHCGMEIQIFSKRAARELAKAMRLAGRDPLDPAAVVSARHGPARGFTLT